MDVEDLSLRIIVGTAAAKFDDSHVRMGIHVDADGRGFVVLSVQDGRKDLFAFLGRREFEAVKAIVAKTDRTLAELQASGKLLTME